MTSITALLGLAAAAQATDHLCGTMRFPEAPAALAAQCDSVRARALERLAALLAIPDARRTFRDTAQELDSLLVDLEEEAAPLTVLRHLSPSLGVRVVAGECHAAVSGLEVEIMGREDVYGALKGVFERGGALAPEDARLLGRLSREFKRNGALLSVDDRARLRLFRKTLGDHEREFNRHHVESDDAVPFTAAELEGVPAEVLRGFERLPDGRLKVPADNAAFDAVATDCKNSETRRRLEFAFNNRTYPENLPVEEQVFSLRHRVARLLGYPSYAHLAVEDRMAATPENVRAFIGRVRRGVAAKAGRHVEALLALKREEAPGAASLNAWDVRYYENLLTRRADLPDPEAVAAYFPLDRALDAALAAAGGAFGLRFQEVKPAAAWHPDVRLVEAFDAKTGARLGRFYLDLFARNGKAKSNPDLPLMSRRAGAGQPCRVAASILVMNLRRPGSGPVLLKHAQVVSLLHGLGHALHQTLSAPKHAGFSGSRVALDFADVPAKVLEEWAWDKGVLRKLSGHHQDGRPLPEAMAEAVVRSRWEYGSLAALAWAAQATFDLDAHAGEVADAAALNRSLVAEIALVPQTPGTHPELKYSIVKGGGLWLYVVRWSEAVAMDVAGRFAAAGLLDPKAGMEFRRKVLEPGGSVEPREALKAFLGRDPSEDAFVKRLE
ncbi:MAG: hypothetical protein HY927_06815 [Elusimicrobia bacterium]|nr:hypothetical protein [Elusimicrobiota bacterium]